MNDDDDNWMRAVVSYWAPPMMPGFSMVLPQESVRREAAVTERARIVADLRAIADDVTNPTNKLALLMVAMWIEHE